MVLRSLAGHYASLPVDTFPPIGWARQKSHLILEINRTGNLIGLEWAGGAEHEVPIPRPRTSGDAPCALYDKILYLIDLPATIGLDTEKPSAAEEQKFLATSRNRRLAFRIGTETITAELSKRGRLDDGAAAILAFSQRDAPVTWMDLLDLQPDLLDIRKKGRTKAKDCWCLFRLFGDPHTVLARPGLRHHPYLTDYALDPFLLPDRTRSRCVVSGVETTRKLKLFPSPDSDKATLVSFNDHTCTNGVLKQGANAPIDAEFGFRSMRSLGWLTTHHSIQFGPVTWVSYAAETTDLDDFGRSFINADDEFHQLSRSLTAQHRVGVPPSVLFEECRNFITERGGRVGLQEASPFYVLAVHSEAQGRRAVRHFEQTSAGLFVARVAKAASELELCPGRPDNDQRPFSTRAAAWMLSRGIHKYGTASRQLDRSSESITQSMLTGSRYHPELFWAALGRFASHDRNWHAASLMKAFLSRNRNTAMTVNLDPTRSDPAYLAGRLFAVLEGLQTAHHRRRFVSASSALGSEKAGKESGRANSTRISTLRRFPEAMRMPAAVLPGLISMAHKAWLPGLETAQKGGLANFYDRLLQDVGSLFEDGRLPPTLDPDGQGRFAIGYWHQRSAIYEKKRDAGGASGDEADAGILDEQTPALSST